VYNGRKTVVVVVGLDRATGWLMVLQRRGNVLEDCVGFDHGLRGRPVCWLILPAATDINAVHIQAAFVVLLRMSRCLYCCYENRRGTARRASFMLSAVFITARCCASAVLAMALCPSVCPSVRHKPVFY